MTIGHFTYIPNISFETQAVAMEELGETEIVRNQALMELRSRVLGAGRFVNCRLDASFLLRFLRHQKFNVDQALATLTRYILMRQEYPDSFRNLTLQDPVLLDIIDRGVIFALPQRDRFGRRVIFTIGGNIVPGKHKLPDVMRAIMLCFETLLEDEENQVLGFSYIFDESGVGLSHLRCLWDGMSSAKLLARTEKALPMRHRQLDFMRLPVLTQMAFKLTKSLLSQKLQKRIRVHSSDKEFRHNVDLAILPKEYGGQIPMSQMIEEFKTEVEIKQVNISKLDSIHYSSI